jgi:hypothetical protein
VNPIATDICIMWLEVIARKVFKTAIRGAEYAWANFIR